MLDILCAYLYEDRSRMSVAAKKGTSLAVEKEPVVGLRPDQV